MTTNTTILEQLERLGAAFPWDRVQITVERAPEGELKFSAYIPSNDKFAWPSHFSFSNPTLEAAVDTAIATSPPRDPAKTRDAKIKELEETIVKLRAVDIGLPPYVPNRELAANNSTAPIDV